MGQNVGAGRGREPRLRDPVRSDLATVVRNILRRRAAVPLEARPRFAVGGPAWKPARRRPGTRPSRHLKLRRHSRAFPATSAISVIRSSTVGRQAGFRAIAEQIGRSGVPAEICGAVAMFATSDGEAAVCTEPRFVRKTTAPHGSGSHSQPERWGPAPASPRLATILGST